MGAGRGFRGLRVGAGLGRVGGVECSGMGSPRSATLAPLLWYRAEARMRRVGMRESSVATPMAPSSLIPSMTPMAVGLGSSLG